MSAASSTSSSAPTPAPPAPASAPASPTGHAVTQEEIATVVASDRPDVATTSTSTSTSSVTGSNTTTVTSEEGEEKVVEFVWHIKWKTHTYDLLLTDSATIGSLRQQLYNLTNVKPEHQKLMVKYKGKINDELKLTQLDLTNLQHYKFQMIGNEEKDLFMGDRDIKENLDIIDDLDVEYDPLDHHLAADDHYRKKLQKRLAALQVCLISPIRPGKKLLVLDLDYTLFDMKTKSDDFKSLKRPYTHRFLAALYPHYEFVIWSQTSWKWLEIKLTELGILEHKDYKILFVLDKTCMFSVKSKLPDGTMRKHQVKALEIIWRKFKEFGPHNTCHVDDLGRNFAFNPQSGLKIKPYKDAPTSRATDSELVYLARYFQLLANIQDFRTLDHSKWKEYLMKNGSAI